LGPEPEHTGIVRGPEVDQDTVVGGDGQIAQDLSELASGELAGSTSAGGVVGQSLHVRTSKDAQRAGAMDTPGGKPPK
jgi:hypothetical protein